MTNRSLCLIHALVVPFLASAPAVESYSLAFRNLSSQQLITGPTALEAAVATAPGEGPVDAVRFAIDGAVLGEAAKPPYRVVWSAAGRRTRRREVSAVALRNGEVVAAARVTVEELHLDLPPVEVGLLLIPVVVEAAADTLSWRVPELAAADFTVLIDGGEAEIHSLESVRRSGLTVIVAVDRSFSAKDGLAFERRFVRELSARAAAVDGVRLGLVAFADEAEIVALPGVVPGPALAALADRLAPGGGTELLHGVQAAVELAAEAVGPAAVVVLSDGMDRRPLDAAVAAARDHGIAVHTVHFDGAEAYAAVVLDRGRLVEPAFEVYVCNWAAHALGAGGRRLDHGPRNFGNDNLERLARSTGGTSFHGSALTDFDRIAAVILDTLRDGYVIAVEAPEPAAAGGRPRVEVALRGRPGLRVRMPAPDGLKKRRPR